MIYYKKKAQQDVGATAIEYGILSALIGVATITGLQLTGVQLKRTYCIVASELSKAVGGSGGGCSGSSSRASSGSSNDSKNSSSSDSDSSNSSADSSSDASDSSSSSDSSSGKIAINKATSPLLISGFERESLLEGSTGFTISGLYDEDGNPVTNGDEIANAIGITPDEYDVLKKGVAAQNKAPLITPRTNDIKQIDYNGKWLYTPSLKDVTFTNANGDVFRYFKQHHGPSGNLFMWKQDGVNNYKYMNVNGPGGNNVWHYDSNRNYNSK